MTSSPAYFFRMARFGLTHRSTRGMGLEVRGAIESELQGLSTRAHLVADFGRIEDVTSAFADEAIAKLVFSMAKGSHPKRDIVISGATDKIKTRLQTTLARRDLPTDILSFE